MSFYRQQRIIDHFRKSIESYEQSAVVQKMVSEELLTTLAGFGCSRFCRVLEVGCCTGSMTEDLCRRFQVEHLWLNDLVEECCRKTRQRITGTATSVIEAPGDIETLVLPEELDLIVSSSTFQWLLDLPAFFRRCAEALRQDGILAFTMFGPGTMEQVRALIGVGLAYHEPSALQGMLSPAFTVMKVDQTKQTLYFQSARAVLRHIQQTGVGGAGCYTWTPRSLRRFDEEYASRFGTRQGLPLDYASISIVARRKGDQR